MTENSLFEHGQIFKYFHLFLANRQQLINDFILNEHIKERKNENMNTSLTHVCTCLGVKWNVDNCLENFLISILLFNTDIWWLTVRKRSRWCKRTNSLNLWSIISRGCSVDGHVLDCAINSAVNWSILFCNNNT